MISSVPFQLPVPDLADWRAGNTGVPGVWSFDAGRAGRHVLITALVHGNELCGAWALKRLLEAGLRPERGKLTLAFCNLAAFDRFDAADHDASRFVDEDLNRQWSSERLASPLTRERQRAVALMPFVDAADWLLDLHSMHEPGAPLSLTGPAWPNLELALAMKTPQHVIVDPGHSDGVRLRDYAQFAPERVRTSGARSLLIECGFHGDPRSRDVAQDQCVRFLELAGVLDAGSHAIADWRLPDATTQTILEVTAAVVTGGDDFHFVAPYTGLEVIAKRGTVIGHDGGTEVTTPYDDCVLVMPSTRQARAGVTVVRFARRVATPRRHI